MAYSITKKEGKLKDIINKIAKNKKAIQTGNMSTQEMKDVVSERLRQDMTGPQSIRQVRNDRVQDVTITPGSPGKTGYVPKETGTSMKDIKKTAGYKKQTQFEIKQKQKASRQEKIKEVGKATGKAAKEVGERALDIVSPLVPGLGKRRTFVSGRREANARMVFGSGAAFNEAVDKPTNPRTQGERFRFGEWQRYKRDAYTPKERRYNIAANIRNKGIVGTGLGLMGHGRMMEKYGGPEKVFKLKDYGPFVGKMLKKGIKKFKGLI